MEELNEMLKLQRRLDKLYEKLPEEVRDTVSKIVELEIFLERETGR